MLVLDSHPTSLPNVFTAIELNQRQRVGKEG